MARGISLIVAAIFALCVVSIQEASVSNAQELTVTPTPMPTAGSGVTNSQPDEVAPSHVYPPSILTLTLADSGRSFTIPLNSLIVLHIPQMPYAYLSYNPSILQPYPGWPIPLPEPYPYPMPNDSSNPDSQPGSGLDIYPYPPWQLIAVGSGVTHLSLEYTACYDRVCPQSPTYHFSVTITVRGYYPPPYPTPIPPYPPYPTEWPPYIGSVDVYIGTAYLDQTVNVRVGQTVRIDLPFIASHEALQIVYNSNVIQPLPGQQLDRPQRGGWLFRVVGSGSTTVAVNRTGCAYSSDGSGKCDSSLLFRVTLKSN